MQSKYESKVIRSSVILTSSYVAGTVIGQTDNNIVQELNQLVLLISFTKGSLDSMQLKIEVSDDGVTYYQQAFTSISGGTGTCSLGEYSITATGNYELASPVKTKFIKVSVKGTGTATSSLCDIKGIVGIS